MIKIYVLLFVSIISLFSKEVSVFGAGDLNSNNPYGLTPAEKAAYKNKKKIKSLEKKIKKLQILLYDKISDISEQLEGFKSVYEGDSSSFNNTKQKVIRLGKNQKTIFKRIDLLEQKITDIKDKLQALEDSLNNIDNKISEFIKLQQNNNQTFQKNLEDLTKIINIINKDYVSESKFKELVDFINKRASKSKKRVKKVVKNQLIKKKMSNAQMLKYAKKLYHRNYLTKSKPYFETLFKKKYKLAEVSFYLGKISYYKRQYKNAIFYFKKSMMANDEAPYIPELLLFSAKSFEKIKDYKNAINFYTTLIDVYPESKQTVEAKKNLSKLKK